MMLSDITMMLSCENRGWGLIAGTRTVMSGPLLFMFAITTQLKRISQSGRDGVCGLGQQRPIYRHFCKEV
jgi:hypothetical protein